MKKSTQVALGGVMSALCVTLLFLTGLIPFSTYIFPGIAGVLLAVVARENGIKTALMVYVSTSVLGFFLVADRFAVLMFLLLFGYYPMIRPYFFRYRRWHSFCLRMGVMCAAALVGYWMATIFVSGEVLASEMPYGAAALWAAAVVTMILYDYNLGRLAFVYETMLRKRLFKGSNR